MADGNVLVDTVVGLSRDAGDLAAGAGQDSGLVTVTFQGGQTSLLDTANPRGATWASVLGSLPPGQPVYVEVDPTTGVITQLLLPLTVTVGAIRPTATGDAVEVDLIISQARHHLRRSNPDFQRLLEALQAARAPGTAVADTETPNEHENIDVRPAPRPFVEAPVTAPPPMVPPSFAMAPVTPQRAQELFSLVNAQTCCGGSPTAPCIPFTYPDDGCWGRAHEMCRLMIAAGAQPEKVWIYGNLRAGTQNHPSCRVYWGWHVAPTLLVETGAGSEVQVIDPSLFPGPVPQATWAGVQGDPSAILVASSAAVFYRSYSGAETYDDAAYTQTRAVLDMYRGQLQLRSASADGPPPYPQCMPSRPGVQFIDTIGAAATRSWFTWGWPAAWHVVWTVMPLTQCPGAPQLSWTTQVERANESECTYWITVRNLTGGPVRFEARYDVLSR